jgi:hypothetical protein
MRTRSGRKRGDGGPIRLVVFGFTIAAVVKELRLPAQDRTWHGRVWVVPYDLRPPTPERMFSAWWDPDDPRIIGSTGFGVGWAVNLAGLAAAVRNRF